MENLLIDSAERIKKGEHIARLVKKADITFFIKCEEDSWFVHLCNGEFEIRKQSAEDKGDWLVIEGNPSSIKRFINGEDFLLSMKRRGELKAEGKLRQLLLLESIWFLTK